MYFEFMKNFLLVDSGEQMPVRLISASWAQKHLIPTFYTWCSSSSWKVLSSSIPASRCLLDSFRPFERKNVWFPLSRHDVLRLHEKFSPRRFGEQMPVRLSRPPEPKNVFFFVSRHDVLRVHEKFSSRQFGEQMPVTLITASWSQKRLIPTF